MGTNSYLNNINDAQTVLDNVFNGNARILAVNAQQNRIYARCGCVTGYYNNNGTIVPTDQFLIKGKNGATVVPIHPNASTYK